MAYAARPTAVIDEGARIGANIFIWHWVHITIMVFTNVYNSRSFVSRNCDFVPVFSQ